MEIFQSKGCVLTLGSGLIFAVAEKNGRSTHDDLSVAVRIPPNKLDCIPFGIPRRDEAISIIPIHKTKQWDNVGMP